MLSKQMTQALNDQIASEMYSANLYLQMGLDMAQDHGLQGFSHWFMCQWAEELGHALKIMHYMMSRGADAKISALEAPEKTWKDARTAMEVAYKHEQMITRQVGDIMKMAKTENDYGTECLMRWYVGEQIEEEDTVRRIHAQVMMVRDQKSGLLFIDKELHTRPEPAHFHDYH